VTGCLTCSLTVTRPIATPATLSAITVFGAVLAATAIPPTFSPVKTDEAVPVNAPLLLTAARLRAPTAVAVTRPPARLTVVTFAVAAVARPVVLAKVEIDELTPPTVPSWGRETPATCAVRTSPPVVVQPTLTTAVGPDVTAPPWTLA